MDELEVFYNHGWEKDRLLSGTGSLEQVRTQELLQRFLPKQGIILDVGGGAGVYALWLARQGYNMHLVDIVPLHVEQARIASREQLDFPLTSATLGDARHLEFEDKSVDAVLLFGPLYHLTNRSERIQALKEAYRVLKPGGVLFVATISRFATLIDGYKNDYIVDDHFAEMVKLGLLSGQHRNTTENPNYFTTAYFHYPAEIRTEVEAANLLWKTSMVIEGVAWADNNFSIKWNDPVLREKILEFIRMTEAEPTLLGATSHLMTIGYKPAE